MSRIIINKMPQRKVKLTRRRPCITCSGRSKTIAGGRRKRAVTKRRHARGGKRLKNAHVLRKWMSHRAKPWMVRGGGFFDDVWSGFKSVVGPVANIAGPLLDMVGLPEIGIPLSMAGNFMN
jgi:hypothetical protein